ncbi:MAG TPA: FMN-binding negative transcriptional regulator [Bauldia sp.]|nr:FMN-binding negative transcriptional regulator [Bauldia sp.]
MYQPTHFREDDPAVQHALIRAHPLGLLVTTGASGLQANHIPFVFDAAGGLLQGHVARPNAQWQDFDPEIEALVVFQGAEAYITPSWYATKAETGRVVPTWNYAVVQVRGKMRAIEDRDWLRAQIEALTRAQEGGREHQWHVGDAPEAFIEGQIKGIVGIEIAITHIDGKWKVSQNRSAADQTGVVAGLTGIGGETELAMADLVAARRKAGS